MKKLIAIIVASTLFLVSSATLAGTETTTEKGKRVDCQLQSGAWDYLPSTTCKELGGRH